MTRNEALEIARANYKARKAADIENLFRGGPAVDNSAYGYKHGWYTVGEHSFNTEHVTGEAYDPLQGGWAFL